MVIIQVKKTNNLFQNLKGLLFTETPFPILLNTHFGIHTFFMKYPIDVIILNHQNQVKAIKKNLKPNQVFFWNFKYNQVLELPDNTIDNLKIKLGDEIKITESQL